MYNPGPDYLSAGDTFLPSIYATFSVLYFIMLVYWIWFFIVPREGNMVFSIHHLMTVALLLKLAAIFFHAVEMHFLKINGHPGGWTWIYLLFSLLKGISFFVVVALIGTGWAFIKPYLTDRDRNVFLVVLPLQIISNIALIIIEETSPGTQSWFTWYDIFRLVDIICCVAILLPIVESIKHLQEASKVDGKAAENIEKLKLFREFYLLVVSYIYFTRIIVFLLNSTLFYNWMWISTFVSELSTALFFMTTGYYFRPVPSNPYLTTKSEREESSEP